MSISNIIGDTSSDVDAKKVSWANIVCNSIYSLEGYNGGEINVDTINAISIDTIDLKATDIIVTNINGKPPATVKNSSSSGSSLVSEPSPSDYEIRRLRSGTGISLVEDPDYVEIVSTVNSGVNAVNSLGTGESLLNPSGAVPIIGVKSLVAGTGVTLTPTPNDLTVTSVAANGYVAYQSAVPDPAPNGVAPTNVWLPVQTLTVSGTILPSSKLVIAYDGWWINPNPAATVTGQFIIYVTSPSAVVTTSQLTISVLRQSLPTVTDFMATQSQNYVMPITQLGNYTIEVRGSTALSATASGLWNFYAYVTN